MRNLVLSMIAFVLCMSVGIIPAQATNTPVFKLTLPPIMYTQLTPIEWALDHGLYEKAGLKVIPERVRYSADRAMVISGKADASWYASTYFRVRNKLCTRLVFDYVKWYPMLFLGTVESVKDLEGKALAASNIESPAYRKILDEHDTNARLVVVGNMNKRLLDMLSGRSYAALIFEPLASIAKHLVQIENEKVVKRMNVLVSGKEATPWTIGGVVVRCDYIKAHPDALKTFIKVTAKSARQVVDPKNEQAVKEFVRKRTNIEEYFDRFEKQDAFKNWHIEESVTIEEIVDEIYNKMVQNLDTSTNLNEESVRKIVSFARLQPFDSIDVSRYIWEPSK